MTDADEIRALCEQSYQQGAEDALTTMAETFDALDNPDAAALARECLNVAISARGLGA